MTLDYDEIIEVMANSIQKTLDRPDNWGVTPYGMVAKAAFKALQDYMPQNKGVEKLYSQSADAVVLWAELKNLGR